MPEPVINLAAVEPLFAPPENPSLTVEVKV
jgi:hypothetical protein